MATASVSLQDKYTLGAGRVYMTGTQALVRLVLMQRARDKSRGLNTAGYVSGYRGSPLGNVDREFWRAEKLLSPENIHFKPGVNEDLAATAVWGTQQVGLFEGARVDGVFSMWYGKGPGVDRSGDVFRHGNFAGTAANGGVLVLAGDDPACKSSTVPSQSEYAFIDAQIPILNPANAQELLDFGLIGWAMSRYSGLWVGMKTITEIMDSSASISVDPDRINLVEPDDFEMPEDGLHIRWPDQPLAQETRLQKHKLYAALAFARANGVNRIVIDSPNPRIGIVSTGKSYLDVMQALDDLGIDAGYAAELGLRVYKVGMPWPLEREGIREFAEGLEEIIVVEEKRAVIENQLKEQLYNWREDVRPRVVGKFDETGEWVLPSASELTPARVARVIAARLKRFVTSERIEKRLEFLDRKEAALASPGHPDFLRTPYFCAGCPHNTSTKVPEGSRAAAGIGCHFMAVWMNRSTVTYSHMGGEGANWNGIAPFSDTRHLFVNLGDGTYFHSGLLAIRAAVAAKVNVTYKILYNDAVAMTGGQPHDGPLSVPLITRQVSAEGVDRIAVVSDQPGKYAPGTDFASGVTFHHRHDLDAVQKELRDLTGASVIVYDQTCAAELRRRRKRGLAPDPQKRAFINEAVCEGCGDCGVVSNCVAIRPTETPYGRKRAIDQSSCNKDFSCIEGFCPSFVTVTGGKLRKAASQNVGDVPFPALDEPTVPTIDKPYNIVVTGIGGTGVVTIGALLGMAAHMEGKGVSVLDQIGLAQKNGAVMSHVRIGSEPQDIHAARIPDGGADLLIGCDIVTAGGFDVLAKLHPQHSRAVVNSHQTMTAAFTQNPDLNFPEHALMQTLQETSLETRFIEAGVLASALMGDAIATNLFLVGYAWQMGLIPLEAASIKQAIDLNGVATDFNKQAFLWGRRAAAEPDAVERIADPDRSAISTGLNQTLDDLIAARTRDLTVYQNAAYADRYTKLIDRVRQAETGGNETLTDTVARAYYKLLAIKDEYEVARLFTDGAFAERLNRQFEGDFSLEFHLAPPILSSLDPVTGRPKKITFGPWMMTAFKILARLKGLRGSALDPFRNSTDRKSDRALIDQYEANMEILLSGLSPDNYQDAVAIAALPLSIRGFGPVRDDAAKKAETARLDLMQGFRAIPVHADAAE